MINYHLFKKLKLIINGNLIIQLYIVLPNLNNLMIIPKVFSSLLDLKTILYSYIYATTLIAFKSQKASAAIASTLLASSVYNWHLSMRRSCPQREHHTRKKTPTSLTSNETIHNDAFGAVDTNFLSGLPCRLL